MIFRNLLLGALLAAATAFAQPADSTIKTQVSTSSQLTTVSTSKSESTGLKKQQKIIKNTSTWSKLKGLFE